MIQSSELKVGAKVAYKGKEYTIKETNARVRIFGYWLDCIIYAPNYENDYNLFVRDSNDFMEHFEIVKE